MINVEEAIAIHKILITQFGGASGVRDMNGLEGALNRPYFTFEGKDLYEDGIEKASAIIESIITNHPFFDGNKRLGYVLYRHQSGLGNPQPHLRRHILKRRLMDRLKNSQTTCA